MKQIKRYKESPTAFKAMKEHSWRRRRKMVLRRPIAWSFWRLTLD